AYRQLEAGHARLSDDELSRSDSQRVPDVDGALEKSVRREVLAECTPRKIRTGKFRAPKCVMLRRIDVNGLIGTAMNREVRLPVAFEVEPTHPDTTRHGSF